MAAGTPGVMEPHEGQQTPGLGLEGPGEAVGRGPFAEQTRQPDRVVAEGAVEDPGTPGCRVAFGEDKVEHPEHRGPPLLQQRFLGHREANAGVADLALGPHQSLGHGRNGDQEGGRELGHRETKQGVEGEGHPLVLGQGGGATHQHQFEAWVGGLGTWVDWGRRFDLREGAPGGLAKMVDHLPAGRSQDPGRR